MIHIDDSAAPDKIREFVRKEPHIKLLEYVRHGFNGEVYFARRKKLNDEVVLKFYLSCERYDASEEAVILKNIDHPNILKVYDLKFVPPEYACFISPKIGGGNLQTHIQTELFPSKDSLAIIAQILSGITELHSKHSLVHRDLKPGNILLDFKKEKAIIADLGAVKKIGVADGFVGASKATKVYLPPESIIENKYYFQSDLYQVGLIMFQLLGGFFPVSNQIQWLNEREKQKVTTIRNSIQRELEFVKLIDNKICKGRIAETSTLPSFLEASYKRVLNKALNVDYRKRYQSSSEFLKDIHQLDRQFPSYWQANDHLLITHSSGKKYKLWKEKKDQYVVEKRAGRDWRKDNSHDGTFGSALLLARRK